MPYRFAVGSSDGPASCTWELWNDKDDLYLVQHNAGDSQKFSFPQNGICRWGLLNPPAGERDRVISEWKREDVSMVSTGDSSLLMMLTFPANHLSTKYSDDRNRVQWISPARPGRATAIEIFLTREGKDKVEARFREDGQRSLQFCDHLPNGYLAVVSSFEFDCGRVEFDVPGEPGKPGLGDLAFPERDVAGTGRPIRALIVLGEGTPPQFWELGGYNGLLPQNP